jgi:drug/metabolite transporter (DMT)-like permease
MKKQLTGIAFLGIAVLIWGSTFVAQSVGMDKVGPFTFQASRCGLAVLFLAPIIALFEIRDIKDYFRKWRSKKLWISGALCGIALFAASSLQQISLVDTDAGKAGFLTTLYVVLVPVIGLFLGKKPSINIVFSIILAVIGLYLLSCMGVTTISTGDLLLLGCALAFAVQITLIDRLGSDVDGLRLNCIQCLVVAILSALFMFGTEEPRLPDILSCWLPIGYAGVLSMGVAYSMQVLGQQRIEPTTASLIMSLESVIAALSGWLILHETMTFWELMGCALVFLAVILSQIPVKQK